MMISRLDSESISVAAVVRELARRERRRRRVRLAWCAGAVVVGVVGSLVGWEAIAGSSFRALGYAVVGIAGGIGLVAWIRAWGRTAARPLEMVERIERLWPQARGAVRDAMGRKGGGELASARARSGEKWVTRRGLRRLDETIAASERNRTRRWRHAVVLGLLVAGGIALADPAATGRLAATLRSPGSLWSESRAGWKVVPGDATVDYGAEVVGRVRLTGGPTDGPLVLEWRNPDGEWRSRSLGEDRVGSWRWREVTAPRAYRTRRGALRSPTYRIEVRAPWMLTGAEARLPGEGWIPVAGARLPGGAPIRLRGDATAEIAWAEVRVDEAGAIPLEIAGESFDGVVRLPAGTARIAVGRADGEVARSEPFRIEASGAAFVRILEPTAEPAEVASSVVRLAVRAGAPAGLGELEWETDDGRRGSLGEVSGARDTTVVATAALGTGRAPGDTARYRVIARPRVGAVARTGWRRIVLPSAASLRERAAARREEASERLGDALARSRELERDAGGPRTGAETSRAEAIDRDLRAATDSLVRAIDRSLADPELPADLADRLAAYRDMLEGVSGEDPAASARLSRDPVAEAESRAVVLEAIRERLREVEERLARAAAADSLERLSEEQRRLAEETREASADSLAERVGPRQREMAESAERTARRISAEAGERLSPSLEEARRSIEAGEAGRAAEAQQSAARAMEEVASSARSELRRQVAETRRRAMERAGAETLFLAERQRAVAEALEEAGSSPGEVASRQRVVGRGLERSLESLVEALGGLPASKEAAASLERAVRATLRAERLLEDGEARADARGRAASESADALAELARGFLVPGSGEGSGPGPGARDESGTLARDLEAMAGEQRALAEAFAPGKDAAGGHSDAAATERELGRRLQEMREELSEAGVDRRQVDLLARDVERAATRLERGLAGARSGTELRALARRMADLSRILSRHRPERRRSETAGAFVPADPPPLPARTTAPRIDPESALASWLDTLPLEAREPARRYLEILAGEGVRAQGEGER